MVSRSLMYLDISAKSESLNSLLTKSSFYKRERISLLKNSLHENLLYTDGIMLEGHIAIFADQRYLVCNIK
jgi:hypothetical protein